MKHLAGTSSSHPPDDDSPLSDFDHPDLLEMFEAAELRSGYVEEVVDPAEASRLQKEVLAEVPVASPTRLSHPTVREQVERAVLGKRERGTT